MVAEIERIRQRQPHGRYDVIHSHYWVSGVAGLELSELWGVPLVHTMHTMAKVKNLLLHSGEKPEPRRREDGEHRIVDGAARLIANTPPRPPNSSRTTTPTSTTSTWLPRAWT